VSWPTLETLLSLKPRWKVSVAAMVMRCYQLDIIDDDQKLRLFKGRSARGWIRGEPYDDQIRLEQPRLLNRAIKMLVDQKVQTKPDLAHQLGLPEYLLETLCGLESGYFSYEAPVNNLVELKLSLNESKSKPSNSNQGSVVQFPKSK
jgi:hypothetical protein